MRLGTDRAMIAAPFLFVLLWSSSFITAKIGLRHLSPLLFVAIRLVACAFVLTVLMLLRQQSWRPLAGRKWLHCAIAGALLNGIGLMAPHVGLLTAPAAQIAPRSILYSPAHGNLRDDASARAAAHGPVVGIGVRRGRRRSRGGRGSPGKRRTLSGPRAGLRWSAGPRCRERSILDASAAVSPCCPELRRSSCRPLPWPRWGRGCWKYLMRIGPRKAPSRRLPGIP